MTAERRSWLDSRHPEIPTFCSFLFIYNRNYLIFQNNLFRPVSFNYCITIKKIFTKTLQCKKVKQYQKLTKSCNKTHYTLETILHLVDQEYIWNQECCIQVKCRE